MYFDKERWLNDLLKAAEAFRITMVDAGCVVGRKEMDACRALEAALNPFNYTPPPELRGDDQR